ncbi:MAG: hypothetical protein KC425_19180 [Anaerolineales bacterium]|nr:hypothetical protein [Anaerolineales bacterium]
MQNHMGTPMQRAEAEVLRERPWVAQLPPRHRAQLLARCAQFYAQLRALPRRTRRALQKRLALTLTGAALLLALGSRPAMVTHGAGVINVDGSTCTLIDAIRAANTDAPSGGCPAGSGADTINLLTDVALTSSSESYLGSNGLPAVTSTITIAGNGHTIARTGGPNFRIMLVGANGNLTLNDATISGGNAGAGSGGGILNVATLGPASLTLNNSTVTGNSTNLAFGGGVVNYAYGFPGSLTINNSTISGNAANNSFSFGGGGVVNLGATATTVINDSTITGNSASRGGGIVSRTNGTVRLNRSLVTGNTAPSGADIERVSGSIVANNFNLLGDSAKSNVQAFVGFTPCAGGSCSDISATSNGTRPTALGGILNPLLADNGGPTPTHALVSGSPAVDGSSNTGCPATDQRGVARPADGDGNGSAICDIGAFEAAGTAVPALHVGDLDVATATFPSQWGARVTGLVLDGAGNPVADAVVTFAATTNTGAGPFVLPCTTDGAGRCAVQGGVPFGVSSVTVTVTDVSKAGFVYDPAANGDPDGDSDGTSIVAIRP